MKQILMNYLCLPYWVVFASFYEDIAWGFPVYWQFLSFGYLLVLAIAMVYLIRQKIFWFDVTNVFVFWILVNIRYRWFAPVLTRIDVFLAFLLLIVMVLALIRKFQNKRQSPNTSSEV